MVVVRSTVFVVVFACVSVLVLTILVVSVRVVVFALLRIVVQVCALVARISRLLSPIVAPWLCLCSFIFLFSRVLL